MLREPNTGHRGRSLNCWRILEKRHRDGEKLKAQSWLSVWWVNCEITQPDILIGRDHRYDWMIGLGFGIFKDVYVLFEFFLVLVSRISAVEMNKLTPK